VDGARTPANTVSIAPSRSRPMSSIESAPAAIPATRHVTFVTAPEPQGTAGQHARQQFRQPRAPGEGRQRRQANVRDQVRVIEHRARIREGVRQSHVKGVLSDGPDGSVEYSHHPSSEGTFSFKCRQTRGLSSVDPGLVRL
jgi:hypothetical protein